MIIDLSEPEMMVLLFAAESDLETVMNDIDEFGEDEALHLGSAIKKLKEGIL